MDAACKAAAEVNKAQFGLMLSIRQALTAEQRKQLEEFKHASRAVPLNLGEQAHPLMHSLAQPTCDPGNHMAGASINPELPGAPSMSEMALDPSDG